MTKDRFTKEQRSEVMRSVGNVDTEPELLLRKELWRRGHRYRVHEKVEDVRPDLVFKGPAVAVFVDGCFWHGCPSHYTAPENNADFWKNKLKRNRERDRRNDRTLRKAGWTVVRYWECDIRNDVAAVANDVASAVA